MRTELKVRAYKYSRINPRLKTHTFQIRKALYQLCKRLTFKFYIDLRNSDIIQILFIMGQRILCLPGIGRTVCVKMNLVHMLHSIRPKPWPSAIQRDSLKRSSVLQTNKNLTQHIATREQQLQIPRIFNTKTHT